MSPEPIEPTPPTQPSPSLPLLPSPEGGEGESPSRVPTFPVVGIGASAGGLEALLALVKRLSYDSMAFVVIQHIAPNQESTLGDILAKASSVEVVVVTDGMALEKQKIYVCPGGVTVELEEGVFRVGRRGEAHARLTIDTFFRSLAVDQRAASIGVVLSGAGSDGTLGLQAIKDAGGITFVQDPTTAEHSSMPQSALDSGYADFCLTAPEIGDELMRLSAHPYVARVARPQILNQESLRQLFGPLRDVFGVDFSTYKQSSIERRIERRMALHKLETLEDYVKFLDHNSSELNLLYHDLLIGVTCFFRDREPFETLKSVVFPRVLENRDPEVPIRIWVPGCATGEEAYSIAICLLEFLGEKAPDHRVQIFGTDIDEKALERARLGIYPQNIEADVSAPRLQRFFSRAEKGYQISRQIREMVVFARQNLGKDPPFSRLDLVSCRNVLIYLQTAIQKKVIRIFHYGLNPAGFLLLGTSESVADGSDLFQLVDRKLKLYLRRNIPAKAVFDVAFGSATGAGGDEKTRPRVERTAMSVQQLADRKVIEKYGPPGVVVNQNLDVVQFRGRTGPFLEPAPGNATLNLLKLARPEFLVELRATVKRAFADALPTSSEAVRLKSPAGVSTVRLDVLPLFDATATSKSILILFNELDPPLGGGDGKPPADDPGDPRVLDLERELASTKEYLQTTIEELETTNEELTSANEELQSSNEELQSTNEELSTSKEELQSTNEELSTVNEELHHRLTELSVSNDDLQNLLGSPNVVVVLVGADLRIRRFTAAAEKLLHLIPADVGRPVSYIAGAIKTDELESAIGDAMKAVVSRTLRVRTSDGHEQEMLITPYKTADQAIRGVVLEFHRTGAAQATRGPGEIRGWGEALFAAVPRPMAVLDRDLRFTFVNEAFSRVFPLDGRVLGRPISAVWEGPMDPTLRAFLEDAAAQRGSQREIEVARPLGRSAPGPMRWTARSLPTDGDRPPLLLLLLDEKR